MDHFSGYQVGVNLGGWLSQYAAYDPAHFESFITEADIRRIAGWGMDHVRLPVDYPVLEDDARPGQYKETGFGYIDRCLDWCAAAGLNLILDIHRAPGYSFTTLGENTLFDSEAAQARFVALWEALARRYADRRSPGLVFELLNEVVLPDSAPWNRLAHRLHAAIRAIDPAHWIMVGGNLYNSVTTLAEIALVDDPRTVYTFHCYEPMPFTHQKAPWVESLRVLDRTVDYPGTVDGLDRFLEVYPGYGQFLDQWVNRRMDKASLREVLQPALDFLARTGRPLYCGEFGVIDRAPLESNQRWHADFVDLLREAGIGRAVWSYKQMDFGLVDGQGRVVSDELVKIVSAA